MFQLTPNEIKFIKENEYCRLATSFKDNPHVVPVSYIYEDKFFYISTDYNTKKLFNIKRNPNVSLTIDNHRSKLKQGITINGVVRIIDMGPIYNDIYQIFYNKFEWVRLEPWTEGEAPFLEITPCASASWRIQ